MKKTAPIRIIFCFLLFSYFLFSYDYSVLAVDSPNLNPYEDEDEAVAEKKSKEKTNLDAINTYLNSVQIAISNSSYLDSSAKNTYLTQIQNYQTYFENKEMELLNFTSMIEFQAWIIDIRDYWNEAYVEFFKISSALLQAKESYFYNELQTFIAKLEIPAATDSNATSYLQSARNNLSLLEEKKNLSAAKFALISDKRNASLYLTQGRQYLRESQTVITAITSDLKNIIYYLEKN